MATYTELDLETRLEVELLFLRRNTGDGSGLGLLYSFLWNRGEGPGSGRGGFWAGSLPILETFNPISLLVSPKNFSTFHKDKKDTNVGCWL